MRQQHKAGEKMFVDWAGQTMPLTDPATGEIRQAQIFVAVLGFSNYLYVEATPQPGKGILAVLPCQGLSFLWRTDGNSCAC